MPARKECPLCGELMDLTQTQSATHVPGNPTATVLTVNEWVCKDCEYFEEAGLGDED